ncbi:MAG: dTDP-4-dehydrorhamnose 3,5-epimerase [Candidatus Xenobiia bacterium LiM19]
MNFVPLDIAGAFLIEPELHRDTRGYFTRIYDQQTMKKYGIASEWMQESLSFSAVKGTLRGLHFQRPPYAETKLVRASQGNVFMVLVDLRKGFVSFGRPLAVVLSQQEPKLLYVPQGVALGMYTLTGNCSLFYKIDQIYSPAHQGIIRWDDPDLNIEWPLEGELTISERDASAPSFREFVNTEGGLVISDERTAGQ